MATGFPSVESPPLRVDGSLPGYLRRAWVMWQQTQRGKLNAVGSVTLATSATSTTLTDDRINSESVIVPVPRNSSAAGNVTSLYIAAIGDGTASIAHASTTTAMRIDYLVIG